MLESGHRNALMHEGRKTPLHVFRDLRRCLMKKFAKALQNRLRKIGSLRDVGIHFWGRDFQSAFPKSGPKNSGL